MQRTEQTTGPQPVAAGVPGAASNAPNAQAAAGVSASRPRRRRRAKTESGTYGVSKTVRHVVEAPGRVRRLTAAIVVNDRLVQPAAGKSMPRAVAAALGRRAAQSDGAGAGSGWIRLLARRRVDRPGLAFDGKPARSRAVVPCSAMLELRESSPVLIKYAALLLGLLVVLAFGVRPAICARLAPGSARNRAKTPQGTCRLAAAASGRAASRRSPIRSGSEHRRSLSR